MNEYPVNRAIADALSYHAACNIVTGLEAAANATNAADAVKVAGKLAGTKVQEVPPPGTPDSKK
jgi:hypothetical protein